jgi:hypothetical protein
VFGFLVELRECPFAFPVHFVHGEEVAEAGAVFLPFSVFAVAVATGDPASGVPVHVGNEGPVDCFELFVVHKIHLSLKSHLVGERW